MDRARLKQEIREAIAAAAGHITGLAADLLTCPELGFKEQATAGRVARELRALGLEVREGLALTGIKARLPGRRRGPTVAVLGELDAVICPEHPEADPQTGAAHACGHHAQLANLVGAAIGLVRAGAAGWLDGDIVFIATPAEEFAEIEYRLALNERGLVEFMAGKPELIRLGEFTDVDLSMMVHAAGGPADGFAVGGSSNGFMAKMLRFEGREAHAGAEPHLGVNALNAALVALSAVHAQRDTFRDEDSVRVHPIITRGGDIVNVVPASVHLETYVRARSLEAIQSAAGKVDRAAAAGALAMGASVTIEDIPGFLPMLNDPLLTSVFQANLAALVGPGRVRETGHMAGSTDMGDLSHLMPAIHAYGAGVTGHAHSRSYRIQDPFLAYVVPAQALAMTVVDLLSDGAVVAGDIVTRSRPRLTREQYLDRLRGFRGRRVYHGLDAELSGL
ncbi:MAG: amidohydrolase [bacterium]|nr:amidohydrolase [bacterium]